MTAELPPQHDAHVTAAHAQMRSCGFTPAALSHPRSVEALAALKRFNGLAADERVPFGWKFHPSAWARENWRNEYAQWVAA